MNDESAILKFKQAFLDAMGGEGDNLSADKDGRLTVLSKGVVRAAKRIAEEILPKLLRPILQQVEAMNSDLPPEEKVDLQELYDPRWRAEFSQDLVGVFQADFLQYNLFEGFAETILSDDEKAEEWARQFVEWAADDLAQHSVAL